MSKKLKENQIIAAKLLSFGFSSRSVSKWINVREETISRWKAQKIFVEEIQNQQSDILDFIKEKHFQLFMKSLSIIQNSLESDDISLKDKAMISVQDNGGGIPEEMQHKIFEPNFTTKSSGMGLGLALVKNLVSRISRTWWLVYRKLSYNSKSERPGV